MQNKKYYIIYKTTNTINNKIYIGQHATNDLNDGYMGSGTYLKNAFKKYGNANFIKDILFKFDNFDDMNNKEIELVNEEFVSRKDTYNVVQGGNFTEPVRKGLVTVKDSNGITSTVSKDHPDFVNGVLVGLAKGMVNIIDGNVRYAVTKEEFQNNNMTHVRKNKISVIDEDGNTCTISSDKFNENYKGVRKGLVTVKDGNGNTFTVDVDDQRLSTNELSGVNKDKIVTIDSNKQYHLVYPNDVRIISGDLKPIKGNSKFMYNLNQNLCKKVYITDIEEYLKNGWYIGMLPTNKKRNILKKYKYMHHPDIKKNKKIPPNQVESYINKGWILGKF